MDTIKSTSAARTIDMDNSYVRHLNRKNQTAQVLSVLLASSLAAALGCNSLSTQRLSRLIPSQTARTEAALANSISDSREQLKGEDSPGARFTDSDPRVLDRGLQQTRLTDSDVELISYEEGDESAPAKSAFQLASCNVQEACTPSNGCSVCGQPSAGNCGCVPPAGTSYIDDQEYLFDGGDRDPSVIVQDDWTVKGLGPEDTVMHYETIDGKRCVVATNRVPIYAPRFAAVRKITGAVSSESSVGAGRILAPVGPSAVRETDLAGMVAVPVGPQGENGVKLIDAFRDRNRGVPAESVVPSLPMSDALAPLVNLNFFRTGFMEDAEIAVLGRILANARVWSIPESLAVLIDGKEALQLKDAKSSQEVLIYELPTGKCSMRICKAASHSMADPGDIIHFTIRFDNVGVLPVGNAVIMDSLSPRLDYVDGSQQSSLKTKFSTEENEAGSSVLRWEIEPPLNTGEGGTIHFRCRVR